MDRVGAIYEVTCEKHNVNYIGETERPLKGRAYDHHIIKHSESVTSHSLKKEEGKVEEAQEAGVRRSKRERSRVN